MNVLLSYPSRLREKLAFAEPSLREKYNGFHKRWQNFCDPEASTAMTCCSVKLAASPLPGDYDTVTEERGGNLSGRQRQRIAIARALANHSAILVFDEARSALGHESERVIQKNMHNIVPPERSLILYPQKHTVSSKTHLTPLRPARLLPRHQSVLLLPKEVIDRMKLIRRHSPDRHSSLRTLG